jgi:hypothetical protein
MLIYVFVRTKKNLIVMNSSRLMLEDIMSALVVKQKPVGLLFSHSCMIGWNGTFGRPSCLQE